MSSRLAQFEMPLPKIATSAKRVTIEGFGFYEGSFEIKNIGHGELVGSTYSQLDNLELSPESFAGDTRISYMVNLYDYRPGDTIKTSAIIRSNGGELVIPFEISITTALLKLKGHNIARLAQFAEFARHDSLAARKALNQHDFMMWLFNSGYQYMDFYDHFAKDSNKERALDNFLIFNNLKQRARISPEKREVVVSVPLVDDVYTDSISFTKSAWGYGEVLLSTESPWLALTKERLTSSDFDDSGRAEVDYIITRARLKKSDIATIKVTSEDDEKDVRLYARYKKPFEATCDKDCYSFEDSGRLSLANHMGGDILVEVSNPDGFLKFNAKRYYIGKNAYIDFDIRFSSFLRRKFLIKTKLILSSMVGGVAFFQKLDIILVARD